MFVTWRVGDNVPSPPFLSLWLRFRTFPFLTPDMKVSQSHLFMTVIYEEDILLCPVQAISHCLHSTHHPRSSYWHFFVATYQVEKGISTNTVFSWMRELIIIVYRSALDANCMFVSLRAYEVHSSCSSRRILQSKKYHEQEWGSIVIHFCCFLSQRSLLRVFGYVLHLSFCLGEKMV